MPYNEHTPEFFLCYHDCKVVNLLSLLPRECAYLFSTATPSFLPFPSIFPSLASFPSFLSLSSFLCQLVATLDAPSRIASSSEIIPHVGSLGALTAPNAPHEPGHVQTQTLLGGSDLSGHAQTGTAWRAPDQLRHTWTTWTQTHARQSVKRIFTKTAKVHDK